MYTESSDVKYFTDRRTRALRKPAFGWLRISLLSLFLVPHAITARAQTVPDECKAIADILALKEISDQRKRVDEASNPKATADLIKRCADHSGLAEDPHAAKAKVLSDAIQAAPPPENKNYTGNLSAGFGALVLSKADINATISDGVVRVNNEERTKLGLWLNGVGWAYQRIGWDWGGFTGLQLSSDNLQLNSLAVGVAFSPTKQSKVFPSSGSVLFHLGFAATRVKALRDGFSDGSAVPAGTTEAPLINKTRWGLVLITSYALN